jgi:hypothetical protein
MTAGMGMAAWGSYHVVLAELARRLGDPDLAEDHARQATRIHRELGLSYWAQKSG